MSTLRDAKYSIGMLVSSSLGTGAPYFMPGVGKVLDIEVIRGVLIYTCAHNDILYKFTEEQIYEYDPY